MKAAAEQRDEEPVAARRLDAQDADTRIAARADIPRRHADQKHERSSAKNNAVGSVHAIQEKFMMILHQTLPRAKPLAM
jgi:hypothetical protein